MALSDFLAAVAQVAPQIAPEYGLTPQELQFALIATAAVEGGLGERPGVGDGGLSHGRFQFHTGGGHGTTLLNQGWTIEDFYDDAKVVAHWAPILAKAIQTAKANGYTGGEAIRQGAFAAERPAQIYPADRFNAALEQAAALMGGAPLPSSSGAGGPAMESSQIDQIRKQLQGRVSAALDKYQTTRSEEDYNEFQKALFDLGMFEDSVPAGNDPSDLAQQAFDNAIKLGDFEGRQADRLYGRWRDKNEAARVAAESELGTMRQHNADRVALIEARNTSQTPGLLPRSLDAGHGTVTYQDALNKWRSTFGASGEAPPATFNSGISLPGQTTPQTPSPEPVDGGAYGGGRVFGGSWTPTEREAPEQYPGLWGKVPFGKVAYNAIQGVEGKPAPDNHPLSKAIWGYGRATGIAGDAITAGFGEAADAYRGGKKKAKKWWNRLTDPATYRFGIPSHATGTGAHPGGPAFINENGPEMVITPDGQSYMEPGAPHVANLPAGAAVIPADVPPEEAFAFAKIRAGLAKGGRDQMADMAAQAQRANDPQLQEKVIEALRRARAADDAAHPPVTPVLGPGITKDYWAPWRQLTGVPTGAQPQPVKGGK